jgi:hypothetical protein
MYRKGGFQMMIGGINSMYPAGTMGSYGVSFGSDASSSGVNPSEKAETGVKGVGRDSSQGECQTCKERKYIDGSDENVSFKSAAHISPEASASRVKAHEAEHVSNAYTKAAQKDGKVVNASVSLHTAVCPECGRTYVSGGVTNTMIKYSNESNPYQQERKAQDAMKLRGANVDLVA